MEQGLGCTLAQGERATPARALYKESSGLYGAPRAGNGIKVEYSGWSSFYVIWAWKKNLATAVALMASSSL